MKNKTKSRIFSAAVLLGIFVCSSVIGFMTIMTLPIETQFKLLNTLYILACLELVTISFKNNMFFFSAIAIFEPIREAITAYLASPVERNKPSKDNRKFWEEYEGELW